MTTTTRPRRSRTSALLAVPAVALLLGAGACSAAAPGTSTSGASSEASSAGGAGSSAFDAEYHRWELKLAQCFRDQGLDVADPEPDGHLAADDPKLLEAFPACSKKIGDPPIRQVSRAEKEERLKANLKIATCLRQKGYDVPEPTLEDSSILPDDVAEADVNACVPA